VASYRRRGAHAARPGPAPFVEAKRVPQNGAAGGAPVTDGIRGSTGRSIRGRKVSGLRTRTSLPKVIAAVLAVGFGAVGFAGGLWSTPSAEPTVQAFLLAWQEHQYQAAAQLTTGDPKVVAAALKGAYLQLDAAAYYLTMGRISRHGNEAQAAFHASVDLGQDGAPWNYSGTFRLRQTGSGWKVVWSPSVINPGLRPGLRLAVVSSTPHRALLEDAGGAPLQTPSTAYVVGVRAGQLASPGATAVALGRVTRLDSSQLLGWILAAPRTSFQELVVLRPAQYSRMAHRLSRIPGLIIRPEKVRLFTSLAPAIVGSVGTEVSAALRDQGIAYRPGATVGLSGLQRAHQRELAGTPTIEVVAETASGRQVSVRARWPGQASVPVRTTIDARVQTAADSAVDSQPRSAAVVAEQASTGRILAVASHSAGGMPAIDPLAGRYPPGAAFTIVSTEALLASGLQVSKTIPCNNVNDVGGRIFRNVPAERGLGSQPTFAADFAHACGTAFSGLSWRLTGHDLAAAASGFGLGASWQLPLTSFSGSVRAFGGVADVAAGTLGEGNVEVSPLSMAMVAGQVDSGAGHVPSLIDHPAGATQTGKTTDPPFSAANLAALRALMRGTVHAGAARRADLAGQAVCGQVGTVQIRGGKRPVWASWFVGYRGDMAFAVLQFSPSPTTSAVPLAADFLAAAPLR
jgi:hypothetical protein